MTSLVTTLFAVGAPTSGGAEVVFVSPEQAARLIEREAPTVLDARGVRAEAPYLPGARVIDWLDFRDGWFRTGRLDDDLEDVAEDLEELGVTTDRAVLVYGEMEAGWGDEGRIWWMLRYLGHSRVWILDGGIRAWQRAGRPVVEDDTEPRTMGRFVMRVASNLRADWRTVDEARARADSRVLDTRSRSEYEGETPFWSARGGHVPGSVHLDWQDLFGRSGKLLGPDAIRAKLTTRGIDPATRIITYCTGGIRAAFVHAALMHAGYTKVATYDASWWDWARRDDLPVSGGR